MLTLGRESSRARTSRVLRLLCVGLIGLPLLVACTADAGRMTVSSDGPPLPSSTSWQHSLCLRNVEGGESWNLLSQAGVVEDADFREALEASLRQAQLLAPSSHCKYHLDAEILGISQPGEGLFVTSVETIAHVNYKIYDAAQKPAFVDTVSTSYTEGFSPLPAVARIQHSAEGAVRANFDKFLRQLAVTPPAA